MTGRSTWKKRMDPHGTTSGVVDFFRHASMLQREAIGERAPRRRAGEDPSRDARAESCGEREAGRGEDRGDDPSPRAGKRREEHRLPVIRRRELRYAEAGVADPFVGVREA